MPHSIQLYRQNYPPLLSASFQDYISQLPEYTSQIKPMALKESDILIFRDFLVWDVIQIHLNNGSLILTKESMIVATMHAQV